MKLILVLPLVLLVLSTNSTPPDDVQWKTTLTSTVDASTCSAELAPSTPVSPTYATSTQAQHATAPETSRLPDAVEEESPDYYDDHAYEAASAGDQSCTAIETATVPRTSTEYEAPDYYDDEPYVVSSGDGPQAASGNAEGASSTETPATTDVSREKRAAQTVSRPAVGWREESRSSAVVSGAEEAPEQINWISWLPVWSRGWPQRGPLGVPRDVLLQAFAEALEEHTAGIKNYWIQTAEPSDTDESGTERPRTHLVSVAVHQVKLLEEFYQWMYKQLIITEPSGDHVPESLHRFLDALKHQTAIVKSICHWSPSMRLTCNAPDAGVLRDFFWAIDRQLIWVHVFHNWAASQYNLTAGPRRIESWWLPFSLNASVPLNVSHLSSLRYDTVGLREISSSSFTTEERNVMIGNENAFSLNASVPLNVSYLSSLGYNIVGSREISSSSFTTEERNVMIGNENSEDLPSEAANGGKHCSEQLDQQEPNREGKLPSCVLQSISRGRETEQLTETERLPIRDSEPEMSPEEGGAAVAPPRNDMDSDDSIGVNPDEGIYEGPQVLQDLEERWSTSVLVEQHEEEIEQDTSQVVPQPINPGVCSETSVTQELGPEFQPSSLVYVRCDEREAACEPPERCTPVSSVVSVTMVPWASFPEFPHTYLGVRLLPNGNVTVTLMVSTSCACLEPLQGN